MATAGELVNGFSVDVEDWYQGADFDAVVAFADWDRYESRVGRNTDRILVLLDEVGVKGTFFVLTWNAERHPEIVRRIAAAGHQVASHGYAHKFYEQTPETFPRRRLARQGDARGHHRHAGSRLPGAELLGDGSLGLGARRAVRVRLRL